MQWTVRNLEPKISLLSWQAVHTCVRSLITSKLINMFMPRNCSFIFSIFPIASSPKRRVAGRTCDTAGCNQTAGPLGPSGHQGYLEPAIFVHNAVDHTTWVKLRSVAVQQCRFQHAIAQAPYWWTSSPVLSSLLPLSPDRLLSFHLTNDEHYPECKYIHENNQKMPYVC